MAEREVELILLLNVPQSVEERHPVTEPVATAQLIAEATEPMNATGLESDNGADAVREDVAIEPRALVLDHHGICPGVGTVEVLMEPPPVADSVVPSKVRLLPITTDLRELVPSPLNMPPRVVDPVPPLATLKGEERVRPANVGEDAVVRFCPVSKASCVSPIPLAFIEKSPVDCA